MPADHDVTALLADWSRGDRGALARLLPLVYEELRRIAARQLRHERDGHTLQPTALVHEAYLRLVEQRSVRWQDRAHFLGVAAKVMRRILVDHARRQAASAPLMRAAPRSRQRGSRSMRPAVATSTLRKVHTDADSAKER